MKGRSILTILQVTLTSYMESSPFFNAPTPDTDSEAFTPLRTLPEHLKGFADVADAARIKMDVTMQKLLGLTDQMALQGAATLRDQN